MTEPASDRTDRKAAPVLAPDPEAAEERKHFAYQGSKVPLFVIALWLVFIVWGVFYLVRWVPESWREWFSN